MIYLESGPGIAIPIPVMRHIRLRVADPDPRSYINFAFGDESLADIYGDNVARPRALKSAYDPDNKFRQFFPLE